LRVLYLHLSRGRDKSLPHSIPTNEKAPIPERLIKQWY
jgi:hypothetical protein